MLPPATVRLRSCTSYEQAARAGWFFIIRAEGAHGEMGLLHPQSRRDSKWPPSRPIRVNLPLPARGQKGRNGGASSSPVTFTLPCTPVRCFINLAYIISNFQPDAVGAEAPPNKAYKA
jgi:hypothetical protein